MFPYIKNKQNQFILNFVVYFYLNEIFDRFNFKQVFFWRAKRATVAIFLHFRKSFFKKLVILAKLIRKYCKL
jgi:hypothetical protein